MEWKRILFASRFIFQGRLESYSNSLGSRSLFIGAGVEEYRWLGSEEASARRIFDQFSDDRY